MKYEHFFTPKEIESVNVAIFMQAGGTTRQHYQTGEIKCCWWNEHLDGYGDVTGIIVEEKDGKFAAKESDKSLVPDYWNDLKAIQKAYEWLFEHGRYIEGRWDKDFERLKIIWQENLDAVTERERYYSRHLPESALLCEVFLKTTRSWDRALTDFNKYFALRKQLT